MQVYGQQLSKLEGCAVQHTAAMQGLQLWTDFSLLESAKIAVHKIWISKGVTGYSDGVVDQVPTCLTKVEIVTKGAVHMCV